LSVRRFTPQAGKVLGLTATDVSRPIARLKLKIEVADLEQKMLDVISEVQPKQYRVKDSEGQICDLRLTPYRTADNRIDGVVLSVVSIDSAAAEPPHTKVEGKTEGQAVKNQSAKKRKDGKS
jgi:two-component system CheB/CheR fusion protein